MFEKIKELNDKFGKDIKGNIHNFLVTTGMIGTFVTCVVSLWVSNKTNERLVDIEEQKYQYTLQENRFEKLQELLEYYASFKVIPTKYINKVDVTSQQYPVIDILDMVDDSMDEFSVQTNIMLLYISDEAYLKMVEDGILEKDIESHRLNLESMENMNAEEMNEAIKEYLRLVNEDYDFYAKKIVEGIKYDISINYIPEDAHIRN